MIDGGISMLYRLLAVNIDGTLLQSNDRLNKWTKEAIEYVHHKGVYVALVTNRNYHAANKIAKALKINPMVIAFQGAFIGEQINKPLFVKRLTEELSLEIVQMLEKIPCQIQLANEHTTLGNRVDAPENLLAKVVMSLNEPGIFSNRYADIISEEIKERPFSASKIEVTFTNSADRDEMNGVIKEVFPEVEPISRGEEKLTIVAKGVSKWWALSYLADHLGVKRTEVVAIGDDLDDREMIAGAGLGVAMGNAPIDVKRVAKWVTRSNDENGVAYMLKEFFRKQQPIDFLQRMKVLK